MSVEQDFRALLAAHAPLTALVGQRIAQNAIAPSVGTYPLVVYIVSHGYEHALDGTVLDHTCTIQAQAWANDPAEADAVADAIAAALAAAPQAAGATIISREGVFDEDAGLDGTTLSIDWTADA
jgi:hypothetical protein